MSRPVKTSLTHPLEIAAVAAPGGGAIGLAMCPGKKQPEAATGPWDRDLALDFAAIVAFGAKHLVTLMEGPELDGAATPAALLREAAMARGLGWFHWPIVDFNPPAAAFEQMWTAEAAAICRHLAGGGKVVVHCRGGRGRSGLVAARLLIELGISNQDAFKAVRTAQPYAMETAAQEQHVRDFVPVLGLGATR